MVCVSGARGSKNGAVNNSVRLLKSQCYIAYSDGTSSFIHSAPIQVPTCPIKCTYHIVKIKYIFVFKCASVCLRESQG